MPPNNTKEKNIYTYIYIPHSIQKASTGITLFVIQFHIHEFTVWLHTISFELSLSQSRFHTSRLCTCLWIQTHEIHFFKNRSSGKQLNLKRLKILELR